MSEKIKGCWWAVAGTQGVEVIFKERWRAEQWVQDHLKMGVERVEVTIIRV